MSDYIPSELIPNILARLPVADVLRCTSVCKSWYELITSPSFVSLHLNLSPSNQESRVLVSYHKNENSRISHCLHCDNHTFDEIAEMDPRSHGYHPIWDWDVIDNLNGIVCLREKNAIEIVFWNPSLGKSLILPKPRATISWVFEENTVGFGFVDTSNEYKVVVISDSLFSKQIEAEIYELSTGSWRDLKVEDYCNVRSFARQAHINGILHWPSYSVEKVGPILAAMICTLDLKNEKFGALMAPWLRDHDANWELSTFRGSLCLIDITRDGSCIIWVMKEYGIVDSWEKLFVIDTEQHALSRICFIRHNGEILFEKLPEDPNGKQGLVSYDCNNNQVKNLELPAINPVFFGHTYAVHTYVESLVLIKSPNDVKIN